MDFDFSTTGGWAGVDSVVRQEWNLDPANAPPCANLYAAATVVPPDTLTLKMAGRRVEGLRRSSSTSRVFGAARICAHFSPATFRTRRIWMLLKRQPAMTRQLPGTSGRIDVSLHATIPERNWEIGIGKRDREAPRFRDTVSIRGRSRRGGFHGYLLIERTRRMARRRSRPLFPTTQYPTSAYPPPSFWSGAVGWRRWTAPKCWTDALGPGNRSDDCVRSSQPTVLGKPRTEARPCLSSPR